LLLSSSVAEIIIGWVLVSNYAICGISVGCSVPTRHLTHSSRTWLQPSSRILLLPGIFTPIAIRPARTFTRILERLSLKQFDRVTHREIAKWLPATALQTTQGLVLAQAVVEELRRRCVVLPPVLVIERMCAEVATRAHVMFIALTDEQRKKLDHLLESEDGGSHSLLAWLRLAAR
jgi:hypothetical protein